MQAVTLSACLCFSIALMSGAGSAQQAPEVRWSQNRLSVVASGAPLADVVREVARLSAMEVIGADKLTGRVTINFAELPLDKAMATILEGVNYSIQERTAADGSRQQVLRILSMVRGDAAAAFNITGPLHSPALDALVAEAVVDHDDQVEVDADDDPDYYDDIRKDRLEASRLAAEGVFSAKTDLQALLKLMENYNDEIRLEALKALGTRPMPEVLPAISAALGDAHWDVRTAAIEILSRASDPASLARVGHELVGSDDRDVKIDALRVLAARAQMESAESLRAFLKTPPVDDDALLRAAAQQLINELEWRAKNARSERR
jgi:hypothetical protein